MTAQPSLFDAQVSTIGEHIASVGFASKSDRLVAATLHDERGPVIRQMVTPWAFDTWEMNPLR